MDYIRIKIVCKGKYQFKKLTCPKHKPTLRKTKIHNFQNAQQRAVEISLILPIIDKSILKR